MDILADFLEAKGDCGPILRVSDHIEIALPPGTLTIYDDPRGEFDGSLVSPSGVETDLIQLGRRAGMRTQFMYRKENKAAVMQQIWTTVQYLKTLKSDQ